MLILFNVLKVVETLGPLPNVLWLCCGCATAPLSSVQCLMLNIYDQYLDGRTLSVHHWPVNIGRVV